MSYYTSYIRSRIEIGNIPASKIVDLERNPVE